MTFRILSWNVWGLGDSSKSTIVKSLLRHYKPHMFCLQETNLSEWNVQLARSIGLGHNMEWYALGAVDLVGGILIV